MAHISGYGELPARLAAAVGLNPDNTQAFTIEVFPDDMIRVRSNQLTTEKAVEEVATIFETAAAAGDTPVVSKRPFIPVARLEDIRIRAAAGTLTNAERLALAVLAGGRDGEEGVPALIDAAQEEYGHGSYRVPVRVVADKKRLKVMLTPPMGNHLNPSQRANLVKEMKAFLDSNKSQVAIIPAGFAMTIIEADSISDGPQVGIASETSEGESSDAA